MAHLFGLARIGKDAEIRKVGGESVCNLSLAFSYYDKDAENNRGTQWVDGSLWGKRAESLAQYLRKGGLVSVTLEDVRIKEYEGANGTGHKLVGRVMSIDLAGSKDSGQQAPAPAPRQAAPAPRAPAPRPAPAPAPRPSTGFDDMDDDVPFISSCESFDMATRQQRRMKRYRGV